VFEAKYKEKEYKSKEITTVLMKIEQVKSESFSHLTTKLQNFIDNNETGSILCAVYHKGKMVYCDKFGWRDKENNIPIEFDDIFRIYSMTKPIVSLAALILHEEGKFNLDDPIEIFLPEFKNIRILKSYNHETGDTELEEAKNKITLKHLFTHTSGLSYGFYPGIPVDKLYGEKFGFVGENRTKSVLESFPKLDILDEFSKKLASLPLIFEPGTNMWYGFNHDVLGLLIEKLSSKKLDVFLKERIFDKLSMNDTSFYVSEENRNRLAKPYMKKQDRELIEVKGEISGGFDSKPAFLSGGAGLVSTLEDYLKFTLMLLNGGEYAGNQIVSSKTIELMTSNQLQDGKTYLDMQYIKVEDPELIEMTEGYGFGLGVVVKIAKNRAKSGIGDYGWAGAANTLFRIDPTNQVIIIVFSQHIPPDNNWIQPITTDEIQSLVYDSLSID